MPIDPRITRAFEAQNGFPLEPNLVVLGLMGSHSHGTYLPPQELNAVDDIDLMGFVVPPVEYHLGLPRWQHWTLQIDELDVVLYSLEKAIRLLLKSNPNIVGLLWLREDEYLHRHPNFDLLHSRRDIFSSQAAAQAFAGYAADQLKRMEAFDLERMAEYETLTASIGSKGPVSEVIEADTLKLKHIGFSWQIELETLNRFRKLHREHFSGYMGAKRKAMVRKYQYDVKNAAHLIRLLRMGSEFIQTGVLQVYRTTDVDELKRIKRGEWTLEQVKEEARRLFAGVELARSRSPLKKEPDAEAANALLIELHGCFLRIAPSSPELGNQGPSEQKHATSGKEFRTRTHREHPAAFSLHRAVATLLESAIAKPRPMPTVVHVALDMLMTQAYKSHYGVRLMAENGQTEDAAVLTRRLMELAVQAAYIGADSDEAICVDRAGKYLASLWREAPAELKVHLPLSATEQWTKIWTDHGATLPKRGWAPTFREMFDTVGQPESYELDYRFLSGIAHGSTEEAILHYSMPTVQLRSTGSLAPLLIFASSYYLALAHVWEEYFHLVDQNEYSRSVKPLFDGLAADDTDTSPPD